MESGNDCLEQSCDFVVNVSECLQKRSVEGINNFINNDTFKELVKQKSSEIIPLVCKELNKKNRKENSEFFYCCEDFNLNIADITFPEEGLLDYLEEAECEDDVKFSSVLKAIAKILLRLPEKRSQTFEWVLNTIHRHVLTLPLPKDYKLEPDKHKLLDCDPDVQRISEIFTVVTEFYAPFIHEARNKVNLRNILLQSLFLLLGKPLAFMDLECNENQAGSSLRASAEQIMDYIIQLNNDVAHYVRFIGMCSFDNIQLNEEPVVDCDITIEIFFTEPTKIPVLSLAIFYYLIFVEKLCLQHFSLVYDHPFILKTVGELTSIFLNLSESLCHRKGLLLLNVILERLPQASLEYSFLDTELHKNIMENLATVSVYSEVKSNRKLAVEVLTTYVFKFETRGLYLIFLNYKNFITNSGLCGYITTLLKDTIINTFKANVKHDVDYFSGKRLHDLLIKCCSLPQGSKTDLVDNSDQIISSLNLLLYLIMWDKENKTGIWNFMQEFDRIFFIPLREGIVLSTAHYELEIKNVAQGVAQSEFDSSLSVIVGNEKLGKLSKKEKISVMNKSLTTLTLIGAILGRVIEYIESTKNIGGQCMVTPCQFRSSYTTEPPPNSQESPPEKDRDQQNAHESKDQKTYEDGIKKRILEASLPFVNEHGWSKNSISAGAESLGYPGVIHGMFPRGGAELVQHFYVNCNQELSRILKEQTENADKSSMKEPKKLVREAVEIRLRMITPYLRHWPQAIALMSLPPNVPTSLANLLTLVDDICYYAGDRSVDFRWYARRIALASIYKMTELYMIQDSSSDHKNTWMFLANRINEATQLHQCLLQSESATQMARDVASATFITARNILGLNWNR